MMKISFEKLSASGIYVIVGCILLLLGGSGVIPISSTSFIGIAPMLRFILVIVGGGLIVFGVTVAWKQLKTTRTDDKANPDASISIDSSGGDIVIGGTLNKETKIDIDSHDMSM